MARREDDSKKSALHPKLRQAMLGKLGEFLEATKAKQGAMGPFGLAALNGFAKLAISVRKDVISWDEAYVLPIEMLLRSIPTFPKSDAEQSAAEILGDKRASEFSGEVVDYIESLPRHFEIYFALPGLALPSDAVISVEGSIGLQTAQAPMRSDSGFNEQQLLANALIQSAPRLPVACLRVTSSGYSTTGLFAGSLSESAPRFAYARFRQFLIAGMLDGAFRLGPISYSPDISATMHAHAWSKAESGSITTLTVPHDVGVLLSRVQLTEEATQPFSWGLLGPPPGATPQQNLERRLVRTKKLLSSTDEEAVSHILAAIDWHYESLLAENETFRFIQTAIGLEAVLSDPGDPEDRITFRFADRCAFSLAANRAERGAMRERFRQFYQARSKIVHGVRATLATEQRELLAFGSDALRRLIAKEITSIPTQVST